MRCWQANAGGASSADLALGTPWRGVWRRWYTALVAASAAMRLFELARSRRNERRSGPSRGTAASGGFAPMVLLHLALFAAPLYEQRRRPRRPSPTLIAPALLGLAGATALRLWSIRSLGHGWNVRGRVPVGLEVVATGPYAHVRHPNYVAVAVEMLALPAAAPAPLSAALLSLANALVLWPRIRDEERLLAGVAGYTELMQGKPRFVPAGFSKPVRALRHSLRPRSARARQSGKNGTA